MEPNMLIFFLTVSTIDISVAIFTECPEGRYGPDCSKCIGICEQVLEGTSKYTVKCSKTCSGHGPLIDDLDVPSTTTKQPSTTNKIDDKTQFDASEVTTSNQDTESYGQKYDTKKENNWKDWVVVIFLTLLSCGITYAYVKNKQILLEIKNQNTMILQKSESTAALLENLTTNVNIKKDDRERKDVASQASIPIQSFEICDEDDARQSNSKMTSGYKRVPTSEDDTLMNRSRNRHQHPTDAHGPSTGRYHPTF